MTRPVAAGVTIALTVFSYFEIHTSLPLVTARMATRSGATASVSQVIGLDLSIDFLLQLLLAVLLLGAPYIAPESIHFGSWCMSRYTPEQRDRILPPLRELMGLLALLTSGFFAARIYFVIHQAISQGPLLPTDWLGRMIRTKLEWLAALAVVCGFAIYRYLKKFDRVAGEG